MSEYEVRQPVVVLFSNGRIMREYPGEITRVGRTLIDIRWGGKDSQHQTFRIATRRAVRGENYTHGTSFRTLEEYAQLKVSATVSKRFSATGLQEMPLTTLTSEQKTAVADALDPELVTISVDVMTARTLLNAVRSSRVFGSSHVFGEDLAHLTTLLKDKIQAVNEHGPGEGGGSEPR